MILFDQVAIDAKGVLIFEICPLVADMMEDNLIFKIVLLGWYGWFTASTHTLLGSLHDAHGARHPGNWARVCLEPKQRKIGIITHHI